MWEHHSHDTFELVVLGFENVSQANREGAVNSMPIVRFTGAMQPTDCDWIALPVT